MDRIDTMRAFAAVISEGSFKGGAERLQLSPALISKYVSHLGNRISVRLINRTTRSLSITEAGKVYYHRCLQLLDEFEELDAAVQDSSGQPKGNIRITAPRTFGEMFLSAAISDFLKKYPDVSVHMDLKDRYVDIVDEGFDLAVRIGALEDSSLFARKIGETEIVICASPDYLARAGAPQIPTELTGFDCIVDTNLRHPSVWPFMDDGKPVQVKVRARMQVNSALASRQAALSGAGIALIPSFAIGADLSEGRLTKLLEDFQVPSIGIYTLYPHNRHLASKIRVFVDFLAKRVGGKHLQFNTGGTAYLIGSDPGTEQIVGIFHHYPVLQQDVRFELFIQIAPLAALQAGQQLPLARWLTTENLIFSDVFSNLVLPIEPYM
jgi:DNA-binding transcriptional LysR family regulator